MLNLKRYLRSEKGFTMIEMMVVLIIIAVLIAGGISMYIRYVDKARLTKAKGEVNTMAAALDSYYAENQKYPADETTAIKDAGLPQDPNTANNLPKDPWGVKYEYTLGSTTSPDTYTLKAKDNKNNERVLASGDRGVTTITTPTPTTY